MSLIRKPDQIGVLALLGGAVAAGIAAHVDKAAHAATRPAPPLASITYTRHAASRWEPCRNPWVVDGDSIRCSNLGEIRLLGIDTPDYTDSPPCRGHFGDHICNDQSAKAAKLALIRLKQQLRSADWTVLPVTTDRYGRLVADVHAGSVDLSCYQLANGAARYIPSYDNGGQVAQACRR